MPVSSNHGMELILKQLEMAVGGVASLDADLILGVAVVDHGNNDAVLSPGLVL